MATSFSDIDDLFFADDEDEDDLFFDEDEDDIFFDEDEDDENKNINIEKIEEDAWQIMIVDDDIKVHLVTKLSLKNFRFDDKPLSFVSAYSGNEAKRLITEYPNTALILLDVVMESHDAGLMVAEHIRKVLQNELVRIILRTGQPGQAPEESIILAYDINDYKTKTELTQQKLFTTIMSALRSYRDITTIKDSQEELQLLYSDLAKRNAELKHTNEKLQQEMAERQKLEAIRLEQERLRLKNEFLEEQSRQLEKINSEKDKFFSIVAHDLKGPFQPLLGYSELLLLAPEMLTPSKIQQIGQQINHTAKNIYDLLENLLHWSGMQMGRMQYQPIVIDLPKLIDENIRLLSENALKKQITLRNDVSAELLVYADQNMLNTVMRNLISNSLKFTPLGGDVMIRASNKGYFAQNEENNSYIRLSVTDNGVGMSSEHAQAVFQLHSHITTLGTASEQGTGLGLIICKEMVEKNKGQIWIDSHLGVGTTVHFTVPLSS